VNSTEQTTLTIKALRELAAERKRRAGSHALKGPHQADRREALRAEGRDADRLAATLAHHMPAEGMVRLHLDWHVGALTDIGIGGLKMEWLTAEDDQTGISYDLTSGAGLMNPHLEASARRDGHGVYARADIRPLTRTLFDYLERRLAGAQGQHTAGTVCALAACGQHHTEASAAALNTDEAARQAVEEVTPQ
jgi:hypothetical protein